LSWYRSYRFFNFRLWRDLCRLDIYHYTWKFWGDKTSAFLNFIVSSEKISCIFMGLGIMLFFSWLGSMLRPNLNFGYLPTDLVTTQAKNLVDRKKHFTAWSYYSTVIHDMTSKHDVKTKYCRRGTNQELSEPRSRWPNQINASASSNSTFICTWKNWKNEKWLLTYHTWMY